MEVFVTDLLSLFLTKIYVLSLIYFCLGNKKNQSSKGIVPEPLSVFLFSKQPEWVSLVHPLTPHATHLPWSQSTETV